MSKHVRILLVAYLMVSFMDLGHHYLRLPPHCGLSRPFQHHRNEICTLGKKLRIDARNFAQGGNVDISARSWRILACGVAWVSFPMDHW